MTKLALCIGINNYPGTDMDLAGCVNDANHWAAELTPRGFPGPGRTFFVTGAAKNGPVDVTFECARDKFCHPTDLEGEDAEAAILRRYRNANNKVVVRSPTSAAEGRFETEIELPEPLKPGKYFLKAYAPGSIGSREIVIPE